MPELPCSHIHPVQGKFSLPKVGRVLDSRKIIPEKYFLEIMGQRAVGNNSKRKIRFSHCEDGVQDVKYKKSVFLCICVCNFHFPRGEKCIVHIFVISRAKYEIFRNL